MLCPNCGTDVGDEVRLCDSCESERAARRRAGAASAQDDAAEERAKLAGEESSNTAEAVIEEMLPGEAFASESERWATLVKEDRYAPFLARFTAAVIDLGVVNLALSLSWLLLAQVATPAEQTTHASSAGMFGFLSTIVQFLLLLIGAGFPYFVLFEFSPLAATPGKLFVGLVVTTTEGAKLSFREALVRHAARALSVVTLGLGYLLAALTPRRQAIHDGVARTLVLESRALPRPMIAGTLIFALCFSSGTVLLVRSAKQAADVVTTIVPTPTPAPPKQLAQVGEKELHLPFSIAILRPEAREVEIGFFRSAPKGFDEDTVRRQDSLSDVDGVTPDIQVVVRYKDRASVCSPFGVESYAFTFNKTDGGFPLAEKQTSFTQAIRLGENEEGAKAMSFISIGCRANDGGALEANFKGFREIAVGDEPLRFSWELLSNTKVLVPQPIEKVELDSDMARASVALLDKEANNLQIGYFAADLTLEDREELRKQKKLDVLPDNRPIAVISFSLSKGVMSLATEDVAGYRIAVYRADAIRFPGEEDVVRFEYVGAPRVLDLGGVLRDGERVNGTIMGRAIKRFGNEARQFIWELDFDTEILDIAVASKIVDPASTAHYIGRVTAGEVPVEFQGAIAMHYSETNDIAVGFYAEPLSDAEIEECKRRKTVASTLDRRHAAMILVFDFKRERLQGVTAEDVLGYTAYFRRDVQGGLSFPGQHDAVSVKRLIEEGGRREVRNVRGDLKAGQKLLIEMVARATPTGSNTEFKWDVRSEIPIVDSVTGDAESSVGR